MPNARSPRTRRSLAAATLALSLFGAFGCARRPAVETGPTLPLRRVVVYRNGVGYFERQGHVEGEAVNFRVTQAEVGDFLATLAVMEQGGSSVRSAAFPMPEEQVGDAPPAPERRRNVRLALDGREHDLVVGYTVETPIWRPTYRLVFQGTQPQVQAWGIVQNLSGEDWTDVNLSLVSGSPVSFRSELATPVIPVRPIVTDRGAVIDAVPQSDTTLAQEEQRAVATTAPTPQASPEPMADYADDEGGGGRAANTRTAAARRRPMPSQRPSGGAPMAPPSVSGGYYRAPIAAAPPPPPSSTPRNLASLAALAVQGGSTRYDLPQTVTIPDRSATMVMLVARDVPGEQMYLFAPDAGVGDSGSHPFHVARFENRTGGTLERGIAVESSQTSAVEGARLVRMVRESLTVERYSVTRTTYRARNGMDRAVRLLYRHALNGAQTHEPPPGTENSNGNALVPTSIDPHGRSEVVLTTRSPFSVGVDFANVFAAEAITAYLRDGHPADAVAATLRGALDLRQQIADLTQQRDNQVTRRDDLQRNAEETRGNLTAIQRNPAAADLRAQLTARLARTATEIDQAIRRIVELDTQIGERRVRFSEAVRTIDVDASVAAPRATP